MLYNNYPLKDSLFSSDTKNRLTQLESNFRIGQKNEQITEQQHEVEKQTAERNTFFLISAAAGLLLVISLIFYSRTRHNNNLLTEKNNQIKRQNDELEHTISNLKATQRQLIQSEKMASLGELTAGIAHEIQNPLNFINNFSEVNMELAEDLEAEINSGDKEEAKALVAATKQNTEKIHHHGKRADGIVKNMLQHYSAGSNTREPTDISKLTADYLRLAYSSAKAKDKNFDVELVTNFPTDIPQIEIMQQDIGRAMINLFNNAFYSVTQKAKTAGVDYKPKVSVTTELYTPPPCGGGHGVRLSVADNGTGIPDSIKEKIMQPFFTTKPTGEATGLGLSVTYDVVVKAHGGNIAVNSTVGEGAEFIVQLPLGS